MMTVENLPCVTERHDVDLQTVDFSALVAAGDPVILRGAFIDKPLVQAGLRSRDDAMDYLRKFDMKRPITCYMAAPEHRGRFFYDQAVTGFNFKATQKSLDTFFTDLNVELTKQQQSSFYIGSTDLDTYFPELVAQGGLCIGGEKFESFDPLISIWMGNRTVAATHYDMSNNIAACMVGRRRFILFPPDQIENLYPGPLFPTPGGQVISMVDPSNPDDKTYPDFKKALDQACVAELEPGDLLVYPAMWWHQVEALDDFNVLVNYWWNETSQFMDTPMNMMLYGLLSLRDRPEHEKNAWKAMFDYYVFGPAERAGAHLPAAARGPLGPLDDASARRLRALVMNKINR